MTTRIGAAMVTGCEDGAVNDAGAEDLELHRRLLAGDRRAFDDLYERYAGAAYGLAYRLTGQQMLAQDVVHDAFLALWRAPEAFDPIRGAFRTYFLSLVHHRAVDIVRKEQRLRDRNERAANLEPVAAEDLSEDVVDRAYLRARSKEVREALGSLSEDQRRALEMAYFDGMTQAQIAERLGIPVGNLKT